MVIHVLNSKLGIFTVLSRFEFEFMFAILNTEYCVSIESIDIFHAFGAFE